jgi:hypothetical protein
MAMTAVQMGLAAAQQQAGLASEKADAKAQAAQIRAAQQVEERARRERLRRALAAQRARFGGQGVTGSGSANAVLQGLAAAADREAADSNLLAGIRLDRLDTRLSGGSRHNLLAASQPYSRLALGALQRNLQNTSLLEG